MAGETKKLIEVLEAKLVLLEAAYGNMKTAKEAFAEVWDSMVKAYEGAAFGQKKAASSKFENALVGAAKTYDGTIRSIGVAETSVEIAIDNLRKHLAKRKNKVKVALIETDLKTILSDVASNKKVYARSVSAVQACNLLNGLYL